MNTYGTKFRLSLFGESHGELIGVVLDGVPAGIPLTREDLLPDLARRKSGAKGSTPRQEDDLPEIVSGLYDGCTTGAPVTIIFRNRNTRSGDYSAFREIPRPGHADYTASVKHNFFNDIRGGGHFSGRLTLALVAAGTVAKKLIGPVRIRARITRLGGIPREQAGVLPEDSAAAALSGTGAASGSPAEPGREALPEAWDRLIDQALQEGDSVGGVIECTCTDVPAGLGEPFFDSLESQLSHLAFSIPGIRGIEFGDGFAAAAMKGSEHNDCYIDKEGRTATNGAGGINGGISNGNPIVFRVAVKPTSSISRKQTSFNFITEQPEEFSIPGRHDACIALRCPVIVEAIAAIALANN